MICSSPQCEQGNACLRYGFQGMPSILSDNLNLLRVAHLDARTFVLEGHGSSDADGLILKVGGGFADAGFLELGGARRGDDDGEVFLVLEVQLRVEIDFLELLQAVLARLY